jgi:hypothetical protein
LWGSTCEYRTAIPQIYDLYQLFQDTYTLKKNQTETTVLPSIWEVISVLSLPDCREDIPLQKEKEGERKTEKEKAKEKEITWVILLNF